MTKISAQVIADSKNEFGNRITTMVVTFPRFILAELNTHRMLSKNSASSRAIPFEKMLKSVEENPFIPIAWQKDHKGMQGTEYLDLPNLTRETWLEARNQAVEAAKYLSTIEVTKQLCNRLLEPFMWHTVIITATEWENFFALRCPQYLHEQSGKVFRSKRDYANYCTSIGEVIMVDINWLKLNKGQAEIHMMALAESMWDAMNESTPKELKAGEWHIPFGDNTDEKLLLKYQNVLIGEEVNRFPSIDELKIKIATARCARVSYTVVGEEGKEPNYENDIKLHDNLLKAGHMSPFEHCAQAMSRVRQDNKGELYFIDAEWSGNFKGFIQYRKTLPNENITK
jgi:thymidylate synthase ThyX